MWRTQHTPTILLARQRDIEIADLQFEQTGEQLFIRHIGAVSGIAIAARAGMNAQAQTIRRGKAAQRNVVEIDEAREQLAARINLHRKAAFGEIDLHTMRTLLQTTTYFRLVLAQQIIDELLPRIVRKAFRWIHQAQCGR